MKQASQRTDVKDFETPPRGILAKALVAVFGAVLPTFLNWLVVLYFAIDRDGRVVLTWGAFVGVGLITWIPLLIVFRACTTDVILGLIMDVFVDSPVRWIRESGERDEA